MPPLLLLAPRQASGAVPKQRAVVFPAEVRLPERQTGPPVIQRYREEPVRSGVRIARITRILTLPCQRRLRW